MLIGTDRAIERDLLSVLRESSIPFHLTGSRFFSCADVRSDWDFFTLDCLETRDYLLSLGFKASNSYMCGYLDKNTVMVLSHPYSKSKVDIQLVVDDGLKQKAQRLIHTLKFFRFKVDKAIRIHIWNAAFEAIQSGGVVVQPTHGGALCSCTGCDAGTRE